MPRLQTDVYELLLAAEAHDCARRLGGHLVALLERTDWTLAEITAATSLRPDTVAAVLYDYGYEVPLRHRNPSGEG